VFGELAINATAWLTSLYFPDVYAVASATTLYLLEEGTAMFDAYIAFVVISVTALAMLWVLLKYRKSRATVAGCLVVAMAAAGATLVPVPVQALEVRHGEDVLAVGADETIADTLLIAAETVLIEGDINGDVVAVGRRIEVNGDIRGNLLTFAESIKVTGSVGGMAVGAASAYDLQGANVAGDVWAAGEKLIIDADSAVAGNATLASESAVVGGTVGRDLYAFAETVELAGSVGSNLEAFANRVRLLGNAQVAGNVRFRSGNAERSADVARHSVDIAHKGGDAVRRTIEGMNTIRETIQETSKRIKRLGESSQEIGDIVELINDIADQTNILALNASIQASMAGEAGRGFAVVADEVQRLAERSANATKQIEVLVSTIQADTNEAVVSMERSTTDVVGGALLAENAGAALEEIEQVSNQICLVLILRIEAITLTTSTTKSNSSYHKVVICPVASIVY